MSRGLCVGVYIWGFCSRGIGLGELMSGDHDRVVYVWGASAQGGLGPGCICQRIYDRGLICGGLLSFMCGAFCYI